MVDDVKYEKNKKRVLGAHGFLILVFHVLAIGCGGSPDSGGGGGPDSDAGDSDAGADSGAVEPFAVEVETIGAFTPGVHGMAVRDDGVLYFSDSYEHEAAPSRVYTLEPPYTGEPQPSEISGDIVSGLLWKDGSLFVCFTGDDRVRRYDGNLAEQESWIVPAPWNVEFVGSAALVVNYHGSVFRLGTGGETETIVSGLTYPFDIAAADGSSFWVSEQSVDEPGQVRRFKLNGQEAGATTHDWNNPEGLAKDERGWLYVADTVEGEVLRVSPDGTAELLTDEYEIPIVIAETPGGDLLFNTGGASSRLVRLRLTND